MQPFMEGKLIEQNFVPIRPSEMLDAVKNAQFPVLFEDAYTVYPGDGARYSGHLTIYEDGSIFRNGVLVYPDVVPEPFLFLVPVDDFQAIRTQEPEPVAIKTEDNDEHEYPVIYVEPIDPSTYPNISVNYGIIEVYSLETHYVNFEAAVFARTGVALTMDAENYERYLLEIIPHSNLLKSKGIQCIPMFYTDYGKELLIPLISINSFIMREITPGEPIALVVLRPRIYCTLQQA